MAEVYSLSGEPIPIAEAQELVVDLLEEWLKKARNGDLVACVVVGRYADKDVGRDHAGMLTSYALLGAMQSATAEITSIVVDSNI